MTSPEKRIAVTGGTGFIGRSLLRLAKEDGYSVKALTRRGIGDDGIEWVKGDLDNEAALEALISGTDTVIHLAGLTKAPTREQLITANGGAAGRLADLAAKAGVRRFILVSSLAAREPHLSPYAESKRAGENAVRANAGNMDVVIVRPAAIIGPGDPATAQMLDAMKRGWLPVPGSSRRDETRLSFMYVDDIARFIIDMVDGHSSEKPVEPYAEQGEVSWTDLTETASKILSKRVRLLPVGPLILFPAAFLTQSICALFGQSTFFNTGKVREMLHNDWSGSTIMDGARPLEESLALAFEQDKA
ncbi:MAG: NAD-dependent epimerase/dehydratase family protein [Pseudomonadota bacterium]